MSNNPDSPGSGDEEIWSEVDEAYPDGAWKGRHDGFTPKRRRVFLKTLRKAGCVEDACRRAGISDTAAYKLRDRDPLFAQLWHSALAASGTDLETLAWHYAIEGEEEEVWAYGKKVGTRRRRDPRLFRMLLQASNPHKYGGLGFGSRRQMEKKIRQEMEERSKAAEGVDVEEVRERLARRIQRLRLRQQREIVEKEGGYFDEQGRHVRPGFTVDADGHLIPPGYVRAEALPAPRDSGAPVPDAAGPQDPEEEGYDPCR